MNKHIYDINFKNIFNTFPQGILDIAHDVIVENFPELILDRYPKAILETYPKELLISCPKDVLNGDEFRLHFKQKLNNEHILKNGKKYVSDLPHLTFEDIIISLEFQSYKIDYERETIFNIYQAALHNEHKKNVFTIVFSMEEEEHKLIYHKINQYDGFTMLIISLKALNQKQTLNNSFNKIRNNIDTSDKEKALFLLSPLTDKKNKVEILRKAIHLMELYENIDFQEKRDMLDILLNFAHEWFEDEDFENIGGFKMGDLLTEGARKHIEKIILKQTEEKGIEKGIHIGEEKGIEKGIEKVFTAINMIKQGFTIEDTIKATGLTKIQIDQLCSSK